MLAKLIENNLYILDTISFLHFLSSLATIKLKMLKLWHFQLGHLGKQKIFCLINISNGIDSSKPSPIEAYFPCSKAKIYIQPYQNKIELGQFSIDLIKSKISSPYHESYSRAKYYITFFDDYDKTSEVVLFSSKDGVLLTFDLFQKCNQVKKACICRLCIDEGGEYNSQYYMA